MSQICFTYQVICLKLFRKLFLHAAPSAVCARRLGLAHDLIQVVLDRSVNPCLHCSKDMDVLALRHEILHSNNSASKKAEMFLLHCKLNKLSLEEWRQLVAEIPDDVEKAIVALMSAVGGAFAGIHD